MRRPAEPTRQQKTWAALQARLSLCDHRPDSDSAQQAGRRACQWQWVKRRISEETLGLSQGLGDNNGWFSVCTGGELGRRRRTAVTHGQGNNKVDGRAAGRRWVMCAWFTGMEMPKAEASAADQLAQRLFSDGAAAAAADGADVGVQRDR